VDRAESRYLRVAIFWKESIVAEKVFKKGEKIYIGEEIDNTFIVPSTQLPARFLLLDPMANGGYVLHLKDSMQGRVAPKGKPVAVAEFLKSGAANRQGDEYLAEVSGADWGSLTIGNLNVFFQFIVPPPKLAPLPLFRRFDLSMPAAVVIVAIVELLAIMIGRLMFVEHLRDNQEIKERYVKYLIEKPKVEEVKPEETKAADDDEGKVGKEDKKDLTKVPKKDEDMVRKVKDMGIHRALNSSLMRSGAMAQVFGDRTGFDSAMKVAMEGLGEQFVEGQGSGGLGFRGTGPGGGGFGFGRVWGMGSIDGSGGRGVKAGLSGKRRTKVTASVQRGQSEVQGFCKTADIQRVVQARSAGIKFCYESELQRDPGLAGKVVLNWVINPEGVVSRVYVVSSTMNSRKVEDCMLRQVRRWTFTKPEGGQCSVNFPFVFRGGGL
jgi:hypothetical protein